jgi:hypothetical protein
MAESHGWTVELDDYEDGARFRFHDVLGSPAAGATAVPEQVL